MVQSDEDQTNAPSLLESILFVMTPAQREHFLECSSSNEAIYTNKRPCFNSHLSLRLTTHVKNLLLELLPNKNQEMAEPVQKDVEIARCIALLKADLEAGVRLFNLPHWWYQNNVDQNSIPLSVQTGQFTIKCVLEKVVGEKAFFRATFIERSRNGSNSVTSENANGRGADHVQEEIETPIAGNVLESTKSEKAREFFPHITTTWHVCPPNSGEITHFSYEAIKEFIWTLMGNSLAANHSYRIRTHIKEMVAIVNLSQLALQFPYELIDEWETPEGSSCTLNIQGRSEEIDKILKVYVYAGKNQADRNDQNSDDTPNRLARPKSGRPVVLENIGSPSSPNHFRVLSGEKIPSNGFLVDIGLASQIKKQREAIEALSTSRSSAHLTKLATLLGEINPTKLQAFEDRMEEIDYFDDCLSGRQREAVSKAMNSPDICLIQGPPGTGKTRVIAEIVQQASRKHWKTLLVAPTHVAVDNVLERVGYQDDISPIRCANKERLDTLPSHIQEFTYSQREESLVIHTQEKVKEDLSRLGKERMRLSNAAQILQSLLRIGAEISGLQTKEKELDVKRLFAKKTIENDFATKQQSHKTIQLGQEKELIKLNRHWDRINKTLIDLRQQAAQFRAENYTKKDQAQFKRTQTAVNRVEGKVLRTVEKQYKKACDVAIVIKEEIEKNNVHHRHSKEILRQLDQSAVPDEVQIVIDQALDITTSEHDRLIKQAIKKERRTQSKLTEKSQEHDRWVDLIKRLGDKQRLMISHRTKSWWRRPLSVLWLQSLFIDFEAKLASQTHCLRQAVQSMSRFQKTLEKDNRLLEKSKVDKSNALIETERTVLAEQYQWHQSHLRDLRTECHEFEETLQGSHSKVALIATEVQVAQESYDRALVQATDALIKQLRQQRAVDIRQTRTTLGQDKGALALANHKLQAIKKAVQGLPGQLELAVGQSEQRFISDSSALREKITLATHQYEHFKNQAALFLGKSPSEKRDVMQGEINHISEQLNRNKSFTQFSQRWLDCLTNDADALSSRIAKYANLVCATTIGIASDDYFGDGKPYEQKQFDLLVIDEAGKVTEPQFLVAATRAKKWVIVGDHQQLPPYYDRTLDEVFAQTNDLRRDRKLPPLDPSVLRVSYFENLWNQFSQCQGTPEIISARRVSLNVQRRMHPDLARFISDMFYWGEYQSPEETSFEKDKTLDLASFQYAITFIEVLRPVGVGRLESNLRDPLCRQALGISAKTGYANLAEAEKAVEVLVSLMNDEKLFAEQEQLDHEKDTSATIGIISFYAGQVELIKRLIRKSDQLGATENSGDGLFLCQGRIKIAVNTVDAFQGKECSLVILSFTRSNSYKNIGFVEDAHRLNVAMSRARKKLILLGDTQTFLNRIGSPNHQITGDDVQSKNSERHFFEKLMAYVEGHGEVKKAFHVWREIQ